MRGGCSIFANMERPTRGVLSLWPGQEPLSEQRLAIGGGNTPTPAWRPRRRTGLECGLDGGRDEPRGLGVNNDVPAEQNTADDLPSVGRSVALADGGGGGTGGIGLGHTRDSRRSGAGPVAGHAGFATPFTTIPRRRSPRSVAHR
jgi:hypothetical protein